MGLTKKAIIDKISEMFQPRQNSKYRSLYSYQGLTKKKCKDSVESLFEIIKSTLENGEDVLVSGFGKFCVNEKNERKGRNPSTGETMQLKKRRIVTFKSSNSLKTLINK